MSDAFIGSHYEFLQNILFTRDATTACIIKDSIFRFVFIILRHMNSGGDPSNINSTNYATAAAISNDCGSQLSTYTVTCHATGATGGSIPVDATNYEAGQTVKEQAGRCTPTGSKNDDRPRWN